MAFDLGSPVSDTNPMPTVAGGGVAAGEADSGNPLKMGALSSGTALTASYTAGQRTDVLADTRGAIIVRIGGLNNAPANGVTANISYGLGNATNSLLGVSAGRWNGTTFDLPAKPNATSRIASSAASTNATAGKASAGNVHQITAYNTTAAVKYLKLYNKATAPTVGTDTPVLTLAIPPNGQLAISFPDGGFYFATGIAWALTGAAADADTTALVAGDVVGLNISYS